MGEELPPQHPQNVPLKPPSPRPEENLALYSAVCSIFHLLDSQQVCISLDYPRLVQWYRERIGIPITLAAWEEVERTILFRLDEVKPFLQKKGKPIHVRIIGPLSAWEGMRLYRMFYPHAEKVYLVGEAVIEV
jgi:hypothetical protein